MSQGQGLFIAGTDTGVGKTLVTGLLIARLRARAMDIGVMKPVETGCPTVAGRPTPPDATFLRTLASVKDPMSEICPYALSLPAAPAAAAKAEGVTIDLRHLCRAYRRLAGRHQVVLVEGAGGLMVPLTAAEDYTDLIRALALPVLVV
ncbi:MAG: dethiobiotin synthase, partial [Candidatus Methylomirabilales bacterium]